MELPRYNRARKECFFVRSFNLRKSEETEKQTDRKRQREVRKNTGRMVEGRTQVTDTFISRGNGKLW
jgi:hypothetical protein